MAVLALAATAGLTRRACIVALLLALFASGWRWLVWVAPPGSLLDGLPYWRKIHEGSTLQQAMTLPHLALASALVCAVLHFFLRGCQIRLSALLYRCRRSVGLLVQLSPVRVPAAVDDVGRPDRTAGVGHENAHGRGRGRWRCSRRHGLAWQPARRASWKASAGWCCYPCRSWPSLPSRRGPAQSFRTSARR